MTRENNAEVGHTVRLPDADGGQGRLEYEAPTLVALGNVRDILALVDGMYPDAEPGSNGQDS